MLTFAELKNDPQIRTYIKKADEALAALGFTEHSFAHVTRVAAEAKMILAVLGFSEHDQELAQIAGYLHDIGNIVNRIDHAQSGAVMAFRILDKLGFDPEDTATIVSAIGNHDESTAYPVNPVAAALILADKTDVRRTRVRSKDKATYDFDIHDRVNYAVEKARTILEPDGSAIILNLTIDTAICPVMDYFEIFLGRMLLCRKAAEKLGMRFRLVINNQELL